MYKVFFNDRTIFLDDSLPDMSTVGKDFVCAFENSTDLKPQVRQFLDPDKSGNLYIYHDDKEKLMKVFRQCFHEVSAGGGLVRNPLNELLVIFRRGRWDLPKGKAEPGELIADTAVREVEEECGLQGVVNEGFHSTTYHVYEQDREYILKQTEWFHMSYKGKGQPRPATTEGITEVRWIRKEHLPEIMDNTFPSIAELVETAFD